LRGKKERRKQRKALINASKPKPPKSNEAQSESEVEDDDDANETTPREEPEADPEVKDVEMQDTNTPSLSKTRPPKERRPKKKRRKEMAEDEPLDTQEISSAPQAGPLANNAPEAIPSVPVDNYIPSFPLPTQPAMPSKAQRARQGLDSAMLDAEIVDPAFTTNIQDGEESVGKHLSLRMIKRLADIGVTELFAGE